MTVYISIGNSDDKLTQKEWCLFVTAVICRIEPLAGKVHGSWFSVPFATWQNACWCLEFTDPASEKEAREVLREIRDEFRQDSIAWAEVPITEFL
jgi:hypothetical protein